MRLYIHDKCMEQLFELPKAIQKKVLEFQKKFRHNSKSDAINLEAISTFKDNQLRTARIDQKYRAIIRVPETGESYYMLWVDNHDEAMDWAKNKVFLWNDNLHAAQIFTSLETEAKSIEIDNGLYSKFSDKDLILIGVPEQLLSLSRSISSFEDLEKAEKFFPIDAFENLFYLADGANIEILKAEILEGLNINEKNESQDESFNNKRFFVEADEELLEEYLNGDLNKWQIFLHPSQRKLVESHFNGSVKVTGGAGTGKTVVALHRLKYLAQLNNDLDSRKIVFTTFTNALTNNLSTLIQKMGVNPSGYELINIDALSKKIALELKLINETDRVFDLFQSKSSLTFVEDLLESNLSEFDAQFINDEIQNVIFFNNITTLEDYLKSSRLGRGKPITRKQKMEIWSLFDKYQLMKKTHKYFDRAEIFNLISNSYSQSLAKPYKYLIADEIQDLSNVELRFLRSIVEEKPNDMFLVGDPLQQIYTKQTNFSRSGISIRGNRSKKLRINYRTSDEIKKLAISALKNEVFDDFDGQEENLNGYLSLFHGQNPIYEIFKTKEEEVNYVLNLIKSKKATGLEFKEIALGFRTKEGKKDFKTALHNEKIPYFDSSSDSGHTDGVVLSTFHSLKGLEFKMLILCDVNNRTCPLVFENLSQLPLVEKEAYFKREKALLYVAISRAISVLYITGTGGVKSEWLKI
jgi:hypothetical protein